MARGNDESHNPRRRPPKRYNEFLDAETEPPVGYDWAFNEDGTPNVSPEKQKQLNDSWSKADEHWESEDENPEGYGNDSEDPYNKE